MRGAISDTNSNILPFLKITKEIVPPIKSLRVEGKNALGNKILLGVKQ